MPEGSAVSVSVNYAVRHYISSNLLGISVFILEPTATLYNLLTTLGGLSSVYQLYSVPAVQYTLT